MNPVSSINRGSYALPSIEWTYNGVRSIMRVTAKQHMAISMDSNKEDTPMALMLLTIESLETQTNIHRVMPF